MRSLLFFCLAGACIFSEVFSGKILIVLPMPLYSHTMPFMPLFRALADKGHNVTFMSSLIPQISAPNFVNVHLNVSYKALQEEFLAKGMNPENDLSGTIYQALGLWRFCSVMSVSWLPEVIKSLPPTSEQYNLIILEPYFCQEPLIAIGHLYNAPVVAVIPGPMTPTIAYHTGNPVIPSYIPHVRTQLSDHMSLWGRLLNTIITAFELITYKLYFIITQDQLMREWFDKPNLPYLDDMLSNISLTMIETHYSLNYPRTYSRNVLEVAGMSVKVAEPLPDDLNKFMNEADHGVIYFSWGSHYEGNGLTETLNNIMESFRNVKQRVLFKMSSVAFSNVPKNVLIRPWFPQLSVLSHKKLVLFITHGGLNSIHEAAYHGVPIIGTPVFTDQPHNVRLMEYLGLGIYLETKSITSPSVMLTAIEKILNNPSYMEAAKKRAAIIRDRPIPALEEAVYWVEYIMNYRGAPHLRPAAVDLAWYQLLMLDVIAIVIGVIALCITIAYYFLQYVFLKSNKTIKKKVQ